MILGEPLVAAGDIARRAGGTKGARAGQCPLPQSPRTGEHQHQRCPRGDLGGDALPPAHRLRELELPLPPSICPLLVPFAGQQRRNGTSRTPRRNGLGWPSRAHGTPRAARAPRPPRTPRAGLRARICECSLQGWAGTSWGHRAQPLLPAFRVTWRAQGCRSPRDRLGLKDPR